MTDKDRELYKKIIKNLAKLDYQSLVILNASIKILLARQKMDKGTEPESAA